jgi:sigma-E factor negative regulatory protein RseA
MMSESSKQGEHTAVGLSALHDGEADAGLARGLCAAWAQDAGLAEDWHAWSVIGDVMRADDLALPLRQDQAFLDAVRARLAQEPVVLAPLGGPDRGAAASPHPGFESLSSVRPVRRTAPRKLATAAFAAGALALAGVLVMERVDREAPASGGLLAQSAPSSAVAGQGELLRSPELDRYLNAHRQYVQGPALAGPTGVRQVALTPDGR